MSRVEQGIYPPLSSVFNYTLLKEGFMSRVEQGIYPPLLPVFNYTLLKEVFMRKDLFVILKIYIFGMWSKSL